MTETSKALQDRYYQYTHLPIGGKEIVCPYWMNNLEGGFLGPLGGKGTPEGIVLAVKEEAQNACFDLDKAAEEEVIAFMRTRRIGVDCSGFVFWMLDALDREKGGNGILDDLPEAKGIRNAAGRANVNLLTGDKVAFALGSLKEIKAGDMIRLRAGQHLAIVFSLEKDEAGKVWKITYAHSSDLTEIKGVHLGIILVTDEAGGLGEQQWQENTERGSYDEQFHPESKDGLYRLKIWS